MTIAYKTERTIQLTDTKSDEARTLARACTHRVHVEQPWGEDGWQVLWDLTGGHMGDYPETVRLASLASASAWLSATKLWYQDLDQDDLEWVLDELLAAQEVLVDLIITVGTE